MTSRQPKSINCFFKDGNVLHQTLQPVYHQHLSTLVSLRNTFKPYFPLKTFLFRLRQRHHVFFFVPRPRSLGEQGPDGLGGAPPPSTPPHPTPHQPLCLSASSLHFKEPLTALLISTFSHFLPDTDNTFICLLILVLHLYLVGSFLDFLWFSVIWRNARLEEIWKDCCPQSITVLFVVPGQN